MGSLRAAAPREGCVATKRSGGREQIRAFTGNQLPECLGMRGQRSEPGAPHRAPLRQLRREHVSGQKRTVDGPHNYLTFVQLATYVASVTRTP
jgi:hypothetical protein